MDPRLQQAAESGSINDLYASIDENPYLLESIDAVPFVNTPLHIAAASGKRAIAAEILNLKPSFARKLNTNGYSPLHLAVEKDQQEFVTWLLRLDPGLSRVKGREGITLFHLLVIRGNVDLVVECLITSPECIKDVSVNGQNALHLAVMNDRFEVLQVLTGWIQRMSQRNALPTEYAFLNKSDLTHNTALHLAAYKNDHQAVRLLLECRMVQRNEVNGDGLTFLDILRRQGHIDEGGDLEQVALKTGCKEASSLPKMMKTYDLFKSPITFLAYCSTHTRRISSDTSEEARGVFLIICTLLITATYQTALQPPGGVDQSEGHAVMKHTFFIVLWVSNTIGFCCAIFYTFCLLPARGLLTLWFFYIGVPLCVSYALAMAVISPHPSLFLSACFALYLLFPLYVLMEVFVRQWRSHQTVTPDPLFSWFWKV
ncbi:PREDICTED: ankyrin repeat-containing protein ITN1-like [Camelina sativa]|uniref:Ankyrin repeat-containing protein ITN1-like n=1 Tax=Camelina sativa TaxID=90675 RepID=A0ABM0VNR4_CAMSA|nr:PREDICTED: ankyrin repeat-containing protein ITN1-like [Camelina sativa]XP_010458944.1 PREDICTED: ankyrin repeat-containing protein ITN1-like [Camelina sativa]XP_019091756.1 PREDICTED: ankyrin repeat-containing protein ITN1-like [Camelina sativa]